jgi:hypothetical protein
MFPTVDRVFRVVPLEVVCLAHHRNPFSDTAKMCDGENATEQQCANRFYFFQKAAAPLVGWLVAEKYDAQGESGVPMRVIVSPDYLGGHLPS